MDFQSFECSTCKICLYGLTNYQRHVNSIDHAIKIQSKNLNITDENKPEATSEPAAFSCGTEVKEPVDNPTGVVHSLCLQCVTCKKQFTGNGPYQQHLESAGHKKKVATSNQCHDLGMNRCDVCDKHFSGPLPFQQHMASNLHKKKVLDNEMKQKSNPFGAFLAEHVDSSRFVPENPRGLSENSNQIDSVQGCSVQNRADVLKCEVCEKSFSGPIPYDQHMSSNAHVKKLKDREVLNNMQNKNTSVESLFHDKRNDIPSAHTVSSFMCEICDKSFSGIVPYEQHMNSQVHQKKIHDKNVLKRLLDFNTPSQHDSTTGNKGTSVLPSNCTSNNDKTPESSGNSCKSSNELFSDPVVSSQFRCELCDKSFTGPVPFEQHINSSLHQKKMNQRGLVKAENKSGIAGFTIKTSKNETPVSKSWFCSVCNKQSSGTEPYTSHIMSDAHCRKKRLIEIQDGKTIDDSAIVTENTSQISIENNSNSNEIYRMFSKTRPSIAELIFADAFKDLNIVSPENLNVTTFKVGEKITFDAVRK